MKNGVHRTGIRLSQDVWEKLCRDAEASGLSQTDYIANLIIEHTPKATLPEEFFVILHDLYDVLNKDVPEKREILRLLAEIKEKYLYGDD